MAESPSFREKLLGGMDGVKRKMLGKRGDGYRGEHSRDEAKRRKAAAPEMTASRTTASLSWLPRHLRPGACCRRLVSLRRAAARPAELARNPSASPEREAMPPKAAAK